MERNRKIAVLAHCVMNQNAVLTGWERAKGPFSTVIIDLMKRDIAILQLPCPELSFGGVNRMAMTYDDYNHDAFRAHCRTLLEPFFKQLNPLLDDGCEIVELIGIENSPSCDLRAGKGVFMEEFFKLLAPSVKILNDRMILEDYEEA